MVSVSGYLIGSQAAGQAPLPPEAELQWWYQFYFATERGRAGYDAVPPRLRQADLADSRRRSGTSTTRRSSAARPRSTTRTTSTSSSTTTAGGSGSPKANRSYDELEQRLAAGPAIAVPTITLEGDANGAPHPEPAAYADEVHRHVRAPDLDGRHRPQPAAGGAAGVRRRDPRGGELSA